MRAVSGLPAVDADQLEHHRRELTGYCYRMLGSVHEAEDAVQDTMLRAWRGLTSFEDRTGLRPWLYRIATNVCLDHLKGRTRRALPIDTGPSGAGDPGPGRRGSGEAWIEPIADWMVTSPDLDPVEQVIGRETIRLAFIAALQHLNPRQRAVLVLRDVMRWRAGEVAALLETTTDAVNSTLRRARAALAAAGHDRAPPQRSDLDRELLVRYVDAFERFDVAALVALLREDAILEMPPLKLWYEGRDEIQRWLLSSDHGAQLRLVPIVANGAPAAAVYRRGADRAPLEPFAIHVLDVAAGHIAAIHAFLDPALFAAFRLPSDPDAAARS